MKEDLIGWRSFIEKAIRLSWGSREAGFDAERFANQLAGLSRRLDSRDGELISLFESLEKRREKHYATMGIGETETCAIMLISMAEGCRVGLHDHPNQSGFILCYGGTVEIDAYDLAKEDPPLLRPAVKTKL